MCHGDPLVTRKGLRYLHRVARHLGTLLGETFGVRPWRVPPCVLSLALFVAAPLGISCGRTPIQWSAQPQPDSGSGAQPGNPDVVPDRHADTPPPDHYPSEPPPPDGPSDRREVASEVGSDVVDMRAPDLRMEAGPPDMRVTPDLVTCAVDCAHLPNVRPGVVVDCRGNQCILPFGACLDGFAHCSSNPNDGCEANLSTASNCGYCGMRCDGFYSECKAVNGSHYCGMPCLAPYPDSCGYSCVDLQTDIGNCGTCGNYCYLPNASTICQKGQCTFVACADANSADCTADPGCETQLGTNDNCGGCGDKACTLANTLFTCNDGTGCGAAICAPGFANCDVTNAGCEASFAATTRAACLPRYGGTSPIATQIFDSTAAAMASDGSFFVAGTFTGAVDFDPSTGRDVRTSPNGLDGYVTKFNADGTYAWTATLVGRGDLTLLGLAATSTGGVVAAGTYNDTIDLDPTTTADIHFTANTYQSDPFVVKLTAGGAFVWGRTFTGSADGAAGAMTSGVALDASDSVYVAGSYRGDVDFDPGPATDVQSGRQTSGFLAKLTSAGDHGWARTFDDGNCTAILSGVAAATDGSVWATGSIGSGSSCAVTNRPTDFEQDDVLVIKLGAGGEARGTWMLGDVQYDAGVALAAGRDGSMYIGGTATGLVDFDPGAGVARRWAGSYGDGFVLKLDAAGTFRWARVLDQVQVVALAGTPDGGVIAAGQVGGTFVTRLTADGGSVWTFGAGDNFGNIRSVASAGGAFVVAGTNSGSGDFDPGPDYDLIYGDVTFISRFTF